MRLDSKLIGPELVAMQRSLPSNDVRDHASHSLGWVSSWFWYLFHLRPALFNDLKNIVETHIEKFPS